MGGMGFIENNKALCMLSVLINTHMLHGRARVRRRALLLLVVGLRLRRRQADRRPTSPALKEEDAYPAMPEDGYGWEKLFTERMCRHFREDFGLDDARRPLPQRLRPARHLRRRAREGAGRDLPQGHRRAKLSGDHDIEIWGDGEQTRSFMYIDDCIARHRRLIMDSDVVEPLNLGSDELVTDQPARRHRRGHRRRSSSSAATSSTRRKGVRGRNSDNTLIKERLGWEPSIPLRDGLEQTYRWIHDQLVAGVPA